MSDIHILAIDLAKRSFQVCATAPGGAVLFNRTISRTRLESALREDLQQAADLVLRVDALALHNLPAGEEGAQVRAPTSTSSGPCCTAMSAHQVSLRAQHPDPPRRNDFIVMPACIAGYRVPAHL